jgi:hypothetical protein
MYRLTRVYTYTHNCLHTYMDWAVTGLEELGWLMSDTSVPTRSSIDTQHLGSHLKLWQHTKKQQRVHTQGTSLSQGQANLRSKQKHCCTPLQLFKWRGG